MRNAAFAFVRLALFAGIVVPVRVAAAEGAGETRELVTRRLAGEYPSLYAIYTNLHAHPELSFMEVSTAAFVARELRSLGFTVTEQVGNTGVVGVLTNGAGPVVLVRADMDGLPIQETSGVPYASTVVAKDLAGKDQPAMHGCAHDTHITGFVGTARMLAGLKDRWAGTLVFVAQPAEEIVAGARAMLAAGLYTRFPKPDFAIALHTTSLLPAGTIGYNDANFLASVNSLDIQVRGVGGHGSSPHSTKDPVVLASQIVIALQTIVSRELKPGTPAVITVGTVHGGLKRNVIPDDVRLELTLRAFDDQVMAQMIAAIRRQCEGLARAAGVPEDRLPIITLTPESIGVTRNDAALARRLTKRFVDWFGPDGARFQEAIMGGEDFSEFARQGVPICMWWVGGTDPARLAESQRTGVPVPSNHSSAFAPVPEPTLKACVLSMTGALLELLGR